MPSALTSDAPDAISAVSPRPAASPLAGRGSPVPADRAASEPDERAMPPWRALIVGALALGIGLRFIQYAPNRSLWLDEALLAPTITGHSLRDLLDPALWGPTPPGFLLLERALMAVLGSSEYVLRLLPLIAGIVSLFLFLAVARRLLSPGAVIPALGLFSVSPFLIYYASELKPYSTDVAVALALLLMGAKLHQGGVTAKRAAVFALAGAVAVGLSYPAALVLAGVAGALLVRAACAREMRAVWALLGVCAFWGVLFGAPYLLFVGAVATSDYAQAFWRSGFMPFPPRSLAELGWFPHALLRTFQEPLGVLEDAQKPLYTLQAIAGIVVFGAGVAGLVLTRRKTVLLLLTLPIAATLVASALHKYPFGSDWSTGGRVLLFLVPSFYLVMGEGVAQLWTRLRSHARLLAVPILALLVIPLGAQAATTFPFGRAEVKPILEYVQENWREGDVLYVHYDTRDAFRYYAPRYGFSPGEYHLGPCARFAPQRYLEALGELRGHPRVWVLFAGGKGAYGYDEKALMLGYLEAFGERRDDRVARGSAVFLYEFASGADGGGFQARIPVLPPAPEQDCITTGPV
jgi:hypothetical protein